MSTKKERLDKVIAQRFAHLSRNQIQSFILQGNVIVDGLVITKAGTQVPVDVAVKLKREEPAFVSRAGVKLAKALDHFDIDVTGLIVLDAGISTGGFTDCLLKQGAKRVYGIDVGYGQVHEKIRDDPRLILLEKTNLRLLERLPEKIDMATLDLSFISILKVMPAVSQLLKPHSIIVVLIKPQFEADRSDIRRGGVVKDELVHEKVIDKVKRGMREFGFEMQGIIDSPIRGAKSGNKEFLGMFVREGFS